MKKAFVLLFAMLLSCFGCTKSANHSKATIVLPLEVMTRIKKAFPIEHYVFYVAKDSALKTYDELTTRVLYVHIEHTDSSKTPFSADGLATGSIETLGKPLFREARIYCRLPDADPRRQSEMTISGISYGEKEYQFERIITAIRSTQEEISAIYMPDLAGNPHAVLMRERDTGLAAPKNMMELVFRTK